MQIENGIWRELPKLESARSHSPVVPYKGRLYIFGGGGPNFKSQSGVVALDPQSGEYTQCADMPTKRSGTAAFLIANKIYVIGGGYKKPDGNFQFLETVEAYDPEADRWETCPSMAQPHDYPASALIGNTVYILGGHHPDACLGGPKTDPGFDYCERWAPGEASWEQIAPWPTPRFAAAAVPWDGGILASGGVAFRPEGFNNFDFCEFYTINKNQWHQDDTVKLPWQAAGHGFCLADNTLFIFGGYSTDDIHTRAAYYDQSKNEWIRLPDMPYTRAAMGVAVMDRTIYLVGGWADDKREPMDTIVAYSW